MAWQFWKLLFPSKKVVNPNRFGSTQSKAAYVSTSPNFDEAGNSNHLNPTQSKAVSIDVPDSFDDVLAGHEFCATLQLRTPLRILEMHGTVVPPGQELPDYRDDPTADPYGQYGIWVPIAKSWEELGIEGLSDFPETGVASDVGTVQPSLFLPFLKAYRRIVESDMTPEVQFYEIQKLRSKNSDWSSFYDTLSKNYRGDLARRWFWQQMPTFESIGSKRVEEFFRAGSLTAEQVKQISDEMLLSIPPFLKALQRIVESDKPYVVQRDEMQELRNKNSNWSSIYDAVSKNLKEDLAKFRFVKDISSIKGVGWKTAEKFFNADLLSAKQVKQASDETLLSIQGVGESLVRKIKITE